MKVREERGTATGVDGDGRVRHYTSKYTQPWWRHAIATAYHHWDMFSWPLFRRLEPLDYWLHVHVRRCKGNCGHGEIRYRDLDSGHLAKSEPFTLEEIATSTGTRYSAAS